MAKLAEVVAKLVAVRQVEAKRIKAKGEALEAKQRERPK